MLTNPTPHTRHIDTKLLRQMEDHLLEYFDDGNTDSNILEMAVKSKPEWFNEIWVDNPDRYRGFTLDEINSVRDELTKFAVELYETDRKFTEYIDGAIERLDEYAKSDDYGDDVHGCLEHGSIYWTRVETAIRGVKHSQLCEALNEDQIDQVFDAVVEYILDYWDIHSEMRYGHAYSSTPQNSVVLTSHYIGEMEDQLDKDFLQKEFSCSSKILDFLWYHHSDLHSDGTVYSCSDVVWYVCISTETILDIIDQKANELFPGLGLD